MGMDPNSSHRVAIKCRCDLTNQAQHIEAIVEKQTSIQIARNRLQLKTSLDMIKWLTFQACALEVVVNATNLTTEEMLLS